MLWYISKGDKGDLKGKVSSVWVSDVKIYTDVQQAFGNGSWSLGREKLNRPSYGENKDDHERTECWKIIILQVESGEIPTYRKKKKKKQEKVGAER